MECGGYEPFSGKTLSPLFFELNKNTGNMAENSKLTGIELNGVLYSLGKSIYDELGISLERFAELLGRDLFCPTLDSAPESTTLFYLDTDGEFQTFQLGQPCRWAVDDGYRFAICQDITSTAAKWYILPTKISELYNDKGYLTEHQDISGKLDAADAVNIFLSQTTAASIYLSKAEASATYLGKTSKAASASTADSATNASKDGSGNNIVETYATKAALSGLQDRIDALVGGDATSAIESFNEIISFLEGVEDSGTLDGIIAGINVEIGKKTSKSDAIKSISRSGTTFTATRADGTTFEFTQQDNNTTYTFTGGTNQFTVTPSGGTPQTVKVTPNISNASSAGSGLMSSADKTKLDGLSTVATSGSYNDLLNKPTIPSAVTESTVSGWGFTKNTGTYSKPSTGIPKSDLASAVQTSLGKADTALQSYSETDPVFKASPAAGIKSSDITNWNNKTSNTGTVTGVKINGSTKSPSSGVVDLGTVITAHQDISGKQDKLVSGSTIKTINGTSLLGSGTIGLIWATATTDTEYPSVTIK